MFKDSFLIKVIFIFFTIIGISSCEYGSVEEEVTDFSTNQEFFKIDKEDVQIPGEK